LVLWTRWTLRCGSPLVDLRLAVRPGIVAPNMVAAVAGIGMYSLLTPAVVLVQSDVVGFGLDRSVVIAGLILVPYSVMSVVGNQIARRVQQQIGSHALLPTGCATFFGATVMLAWLHDDLWHVLVAMAVGGLGSGFTFSSLVVLLVPHVPPAETSSALAFNQVLRYVGFAVGSATSIAIMEGLGGGVVGFRSSLLTSSAMWFLAAVAVLLLDRPSTTRFDSPE
jgi:predicted MFS family arabinose efflux permease